MCGSFAARQSRWATKTTEELLVANQKTATVTTEASGVPGILLAGGLARRMGGGDKPLREIGGRTILARVIARLTPQCECLALSANGDPSRFASFGLPVVADGVKNYPGPLAGILAGLDWAAARRPNAQWIRQRSGRLSLSTARPGRAIARGRIRSGR